MKNLYGLVILFLTKATLGAWVLEIELRNITILHEVEYDVENEMFCCCDACGNNDDCCFSDPLLSNCTDYKPCDSLVTVCMEYGGINEQQCVRSNDPFRNDIIYEAVFSNLDPEKAILYSRLSFFGDKYPSDGIIHLSVTIDDRDGNDYKPMDMLKLRLDFNTTSEIGSPITYTSEEGIAEISFAVRIFCDVDYSGQDCEEYACETVSSSQCPSCSLNCPQSTTVIEPQSDNVTCIGWRITTGAVILIMAFCLGTCLASACLLAVLKRRKSGQNKRIRSASQDGFAVNKPDGVTNPVYFDKKTNELKGSFVSGKQQLEEYVMMSSDGLGTIKSDHNLGVLPKNEQEEHYEVMPNGGRYGLRSNFAQLATPEISTVKSNFTHTYESVSLEEKGSSEAEMSNKDNDEDIEEYSKLKRQD